MEPVAPPQTADVGSWLRDTRQHAGLSLRQIADSTKLSVRILDALERNRIDQLPGGIYRRAIVRSYAGEVGLDPEFALQAFLHRHPQDDPALPRMLLAADPPRKRPMLAAIMSRIGALIPIVAGVFYLTLGIRGSEAPQHIMDVMPPRVADARSGTPAADMPNVSSGRTVAVMISVSSRCHLQVVADGSQVLARAVNPGEVIRLQLDSDVVLLGDNAGAVHFSMNGRAGHALGDAASPLSVRIARDDYPAWLIQP
jgi:transcriptional regulator with XRE-family HTH domain